MAPETSGSPDARDREPAGQRQGLDVRGLVVRYGPGAPAVDHVDLHIGSGTVLALLGPSGCGKSSLLRAVAGLEPPAAGTVGFDGADVGRVPVHLRRFGLLFQDGQLFPHRDVAGNIAYGLAMTGVPRRQRAGRVTELLDLVGLPGYGGRQVTTLSGGEQQRVALARALAPAPRLLLLDEPLSALDRSLRERLAGELRRILTEAGTTALYVTHDHDEAFTVADEVAVMSAGRMLQHGTPGEVWRSPASEEVARFLGYGPVLTGRIEEDVLVTEVGRVPLEAVRRAGSATVDSATGASVDPGAVLVSGEPTSTVRLALAPGALREVDDGGEGTELPILTQRFRRGETETDVRLPSGGTAVVRGVLLDTGVARVRLDPRRVVLLPS